MNEALKARKLGSATARKQRIHERQIQKEEAYQDRLHRQRDMMYDTHSSTDEDDESTSSHSSNTDFDFTAETPSEYSVRTPEDLSPELERASHDVQTTADGSMQDEMLATVVTKHESDQTETPLANLQSRPKMQATLTTVADWNYDRFSVLIDPEDANEQTESSSSSEEEEEVDTFSPIEIAVPVAYSLPKSRPAMVKITTTQSRSHSLRLNKSSGNRPAYRRHVSEQLLSNPPHTDFKTGGARLFEATNSSRETVGSTQNSIQPSRSVSQASQDESLFSQADSQASQSDRSHRSPKRKSSLPLLFTTNKSGHSRMSSIKKFIRSSTLGPPTAGQQFGGVLQRHPTTSALETHFEAHRSSMEQIRESVVEEVVRPKTARAPSPLLTESPTPIPPPVWPVRGQSRTNTWTANTEFKKESPPSKTRQRSGSIGQALKALGSAPKTSDNSMPPLPTINIPPPSEPIDAKVSPTPPPITPRNPKRTSNYSPFPKIDKRTSAVGLGLRY